MQITEVFYSIQGEGRLVGMPSVFIRTSGCNLRCVWCDTPYTSWAPQGKGWSIEQILRELAKYPSRHIVVTGGEPFLAKDIGELTAQLKPLGSHITIETAATLYKPVACDLVSMSPKLASSTPWRRSQGQFAKMHEMRRINFEVMQRFIDRYDYQLKFVVDRRDDFAEVAEILEKLKNVDGSRVLIMGQGKTATELRDKSKWIIELCKTYGFGYTPRLHIELFGNRRAT